MQKRKRYKLHNPDLICRLFVIIFLNLLISWENLQYYTFIGSFVELCDLQVL